MKQAKARARAAKAASARERRARAREQSRVILTAPAYVTRGADSASTGSSRPLAAILLLGFAGLLVLLALTPAQAAYALGPRVGNTLVHGRITLAGVGVAMAVGMIVALGLGGSL